MMSESAKQLAYLMCRGEDPLNPRWRKLLDHAFPVQLNEYIQVVCSAAGTHMMAWGYIHVGTNPANRITVMTWTADLEDPQATGYAQYGNHVAFKLRGYHSWAYRKYVHACRRIIYFYDHLRGRHAN